jgi:nitroimidazol reductase NimA-like FMN-containing flavoprotein (pyridoxamine 5'-phosphate oxidase superfamily)
MSEDGWRGKVGALARDEVDEFLAEGRIARLGCLDDEGWPYVIPVWHEWDGSAFWVVARRRSVWASYLHNDGRCSVAIDEDGRQRKVLAQCRAEVVEEPCLDGEWGAVAERMSVRYLGENGPKYLVPTLDKPRWLIRLDPVKVQTWQGNDWADRYK